MQHYLVAPNGQFVGTISGTAEEIAVQTPMDHITVILPPPRSTDYWNGSEWIAIGTAPAWFYKFNYDAKEWEDSRNLEKAKQEKWDAIKLARNKQEFGGFTYLDKKFDSDQISQVRIIAAAVLGQKITWTAADDSTLELSQENVKGLGEALAHHVNTTHERGRKARQLIEAATTNQEVDSILF